jgi:2-oxoisovalerate dehydrogenase E1 component
VSVTDQDRDQDQDQSRSASAAADLRRHLCYAVMKLSRELDARFESLRLGGRVAKWYSAIGNEATTAPAGLLLEPGDVLCSLHRDLAAILGTYLDPERAFPGFGFGGVRALPSSRPDPRELLYRLCCQLLGKGEGFSQGIERSFHYGYFHADSGLAHVGMISHLGSMIPVAAGCAFALARRGGEPGRLAINFIGEGGTSTGDFHEGLNHAAVWRLPLILVIENNRYAFSTPANAQYAAARLSDRGVGYGIEAASVDGNDPDAVQRLLVRAAATVRAGRGPFLIEAMVGRMRGHAEGDDSLKVVPPAELEGYVAADPVPAFADRLEREGSLDAATRRRLEARISELVEEAVEGALAAPAPALAVARRPALAPVGWRAPSSSSPANGSGGEELSYVDAVHRALREEMERDPTVILLGQDIAAFEGAFRVTRGLHARWPDRVLDTPISESGTVGLAVGAALLGYRPVIEMQFADFVSCAFNQIVNVAAKLYYRFERPCPLVIRLPSGGGVGAGAFHSQNPEGWFAHTAGLEVVCPATAEDAHRLLVAAIRDPNPVIFCEHKYLYRRIKGRIVGPIAGDPEPLGRARVFRQGDAVTLIGYGATTWTCDRAAELLAGRGISAEVVDLRTLVPFDAETVLASVRKTGRAIVVHEAQRTAGFGAEVAAQIAEQAFAWLDAPIRRLAYPDLPVPYVKSLEQELLPSAERVAAAAVELLAY